MNGTFSFCLKEKENNYRMCNEQILTAKRRQNKSKKVSVFPTVLIVQGVTTQMSLVIFVAIAQLVFNILE